MGKLLRKRRQRQSARTRDLSNLQGWLHARGAMWSPKITYAANGVAGLGLGLVATKPLAAGEVLFVAPQGARLASRASVLEASCASRVRCSRSKSSP